jgi:hypothetical protein
VIRDTHFHWSALHTESPFRCRAQLRRFESEKLIKATRRRVIRAAGVMGMRVRLMA